MDRHEKVTLKAACIQAAAILMAQTGNGEPRGFNRTLDPDTGSCARYARDLFGKLTGESWED